MVEPLKYPWRHIRYDRTTYIHFAHPQHEFFDLPSSKASQCLVFELEDLGLEADPGLFHYWCGSTDEQLEKIHKWDLENLPQDQPICLIHPYGHSHPEAKNLDPYPYIEACEERGWLPLVLDLSSQGAYGIDQLWLPHPDGDGKRYAEAGVLKLLIATCDFFVGIDSGPEHIAGATDTPTWIIWKDHHAFFCYDLADNVTHHLPKYPKWGQEQIENEEAQAYFAAHYQHSYYANDWELVEKFKQELDRRGQSPLDTPPVSIDPIA